MNKPHTKRKLVFRISHAIELRIVDLSLQNPDFGAVRLLRFLQQESIDPSVSSVYSILKRNGLQTREKRLARVKANRPVEALKPQQEKPPPVPPVQPEEYPHQGFISVANEQAGTRLGGYFGRTLLNLLLLVLLAYTGRHVVRNVRNLMPEPQFVKVAAPSSIDLLPVAVALSTPSRFRDYRMIWERNLFNISKKEAPDPEMETTSEKLIPAEKDLGLRLVGTVVADDPRLNRALIDDLNAREQGIYSEGNRAGKVRIKKVLRNQVIVATAEGDRLLAMDFGSAPGSPDTQDIAQPEVATRITPQEVGEKRPPGKSITLAREEVEASLADIGELERQLNITAYEKNHEPAGFTIGKIPQQSILRRIGLNSSDAVTAVNGETIAGPDQAEKFFLMLKQGGNMTVKVRKGHGIRRRTRYIHLDIY